MGAIEASALVFLTIFGLTLGQLIVPQDIALGKQQGTLMSLTQFESKGRETANSLSSPQEILVESLTQTHHENEKNNVIKSEFPVAPTSDLVGISDVPKKEIKGGTKSKTKKDFPPLPSGIDFLSTSMSSQEIIEIPARGSKKKKQRSPLGVSRSWRNLVKANPRQVGDRIDIVIEKRVNGDELSQNAVTSNANELHDAPINNPNRYFNEPELPWLNAAVEPSPDLTWTENTIVRTSIGPMKMAEISTDPVQVTKTKKKATSVVNQITMTTPISIPKTSTPIPVQVVTTDNHLANSFHLKTTDKQVQSPVTPSTAAGWSSWVEPILADTSPSWFAGQATAPNNSGKPIGKPDVNILDVPPESVDMTKNKSSSSADSFMNDLHMELPTGNDLKSLQSKGFFASWRPWTSTIEQTTKQTDIMTINGKHESVSTSMVSPPTTLKNNEYLIHGDNGTPENPAVNVELNMTEFASSQQNLKPEISKTELTDISEKANTVLNKKTENTKSVPVKSGTETIKQTVNTEVFQSENIFPWENSKAPVLLVEDKTVGHTAVNTQLNEATTQQAANNGALESQNILPWEHAEAPELPVGNTRNQALNVGKVDATTMKPSVNREVSQSLDIITGSEIKNPEIVKAELKNEVVKSPSFTNTLKIASHDKHGALSTQNSLPVTQTTNHEIDNEGTNAPPTELELRADATKHTIDNVSGNNILDSEVIKTIANTESAISATSSRVSESSSVSHSNAVHIAEANGATQPVQTPSSLDTIESNIQNSGLKSSTSNNNILDPWSQSNAEEVTFPPTSNFDPLLLPPALSAIETHMPRHEKIGQSSISEVHSETTNVHIGSSLNIEQSKVGESAADIGRSEASPTHPKPKFFISPSPSELIPPQENVNEGILHPIEPHLPHDSMKAKADVHDFHSHTEQTDVRNAIIAHENSKQVGVKPPKARISTAAISEIHTTKAEESQNSIWNTGSKIPSPTSFGLSGSEHISTVSDPEQERKMLLEQIREALVSLNGGKDALKPLEGMNPLSDEPGLTHALIGSVNGLVDIPKANQGLLKSFHLDTTAIENTGMDIGRNKHKEHGHSLTKHFDKNWFHHHDNLHTDSRTGHIVLDEKAIREKLLSPDKHSHSRPSGHDAHGRHFGHRSILGSHMGMSGSLSRADVDLSQDLSHNFHLDAPVHNNDLHSPIAETNRESAKLRIFENQKSAIRNSIINRISPSKESHKETKNRKRIVPTNPVTPPAVIATNEDIENETLVNNNSIFFDPKTHRPVDPFYNVSSDVLRKAHHAWENAVAKVKKHIDPIPEIAAVVGDKKNAIRVGSVSSGRAGKTSSISSRKTSGDPNAAFHFLDPVTNAVVPIAALPEASSNDHQHPPTSHQPNLPNMNELFQDAIENSDHPPLPFINPIASGSDINSDDGFFVGPVLFGPVENPPPNGEIEISGPVLAMGLSPDDKLKNGKKEHKGPDVRKIIQRLLKQNNKQHKAQSSLVKSQSDDTQTKSQTKILRKTKVNKEQNKINPLQQIAHGSKGRSLLPRTILPFEPELRRSPQLRTNEKSISTPGFGTLSNQPRKGISKALWNALTNILKANKRKEFLSKQKVNTKFQHAFPAANPKKTITQRPAQKQLNKPGKLYMQRLLNILKTRQTVYELRKKITAPQTKEKKIIPSISKAKLGGRSEMPKSSVIKPVVTTKLKPTPIRRPHESTSNNRLPHIRNNNYQLLLQLLRARRYDPSHINSAVSKVHTNVLPSHMNSVHRPAQRSLGHSSVNTGRHSFIPQLHSTHGTGTMRPIPISTIHQWPFSATRTSQLPSINTHILPTYRSWPHKQIQSKNR